MSECPHKQLKKQMVGEQFWYVCECGQKFRAWDGKVSVREPGADTGATGAEGLSGMLAERMIKLAIKIQGPYATFGPPESLERRKKSHQERIEELTGMLTTEFAECLERGTTPPDEGLALERAANWFEERGGKWDAEFIATQLRALASTQRAPVEQGRPDMGEVSDGYHTFKELYEHRHALFSVICATFGGWKSKEHSDGTMFEDSFIAGVATPLGPATYHMPLRWWDRFHCQPSIRAPKWDGHTAQQVPERIASLAAPDHAREGALLREAKWWYKEFVWPWRADDEDSDDRARKRLAALADGKEGGE